MEMHALHPGVPRVQQDVVLLRHDCAGNAQTQRLATVEDPSRRPDPSQLALPL